MSTPFSTLASVLFIGLFSFHVPMHEQQLIDELYPILRNTEFMGGAQVGNAAPGESRMMLKYNSTIGHFIHLRIAILNIFKGSWDTMDATYTVESLKRAWSAPPPPPEPEPIEPEIDPVFGALEEAEDAGLLEAVEETYKITEPAYSRAYLTGYVKGLKSSANNGPIQTNTESGPIELRLDSALMKIEISFQGGGSYWGSAEIDSEQYMLLKALFYGHSYTSEMRIADAAWAAQFATKTEEDKN